MASPVARTLVMDVSIRLDKPPVALGSGAFGTVYNAQYKADDKPEGEWLPCALKVLNAADAAALDEELNALAALPPHRNIVRLLGVTRSAARVGIATELLPGGSLYKRLDECTRLNTPPSIETRLRWCKDVAAGLVAMHELALVHGDIKTPNVMLDNAGFGAVAKLIVSLLKRVCGRTRTPCSLSRLHLLAYLLPLQDFGLVKAVYGKSESTSFAGTLNYSAPELIPDGGRKSVRSAAADVYAFGCLCYSVFSRSEPFHEKLKEFGTSTSKKLKPEVLARVGPLLRGDGGRVPLRPNLGDLEAAYTPEGLRELLVQCWQTNYALRPTMQQALAALQAMPAVGSAGGGGWSAAAPGGGGWSAPAPGGGGWSAAAPAAAPAAPVAYGKSFTVYIKARGPGVSMGPYMSVPIVSKAISVLTTDTVQEVMDEATRATGLVVTSLVHNDGPVAHGVLSPDRTMASYDFDGTWNPTLHSY